MPRLRALSLGLVLMLAGCTPAGGAMTSVPSGAPAEGTSGPTEALATPLPACLPGCVTPNWSSPGDLPAGDYQTMHFFGGQLIVTIPDATWESGEDSTGELELHQAADQVQAAIVFWLDVYPIVDGTFEPVPNFDGTAATLLDWIAANPNVTVTRREAATFGRLAGEVIDFERSPDAINVDPECPVELKPCVAFVQFPQWDGPFSSGGPFKNRLYAVDVVWDNEPHAVYGVIWTDTVPIFDAAAPVLSPIVEGARFPADVHQ